MCGICERIQMIQNHTNPYFVMELETGYVVMGDHQRIHGYTLFLCKHHVHELHQLDLTLRTKHLTEMCIVSEAVHRAFHADKMNIESLGNGETHLHWHLFPRIHGDTHVPGPVWWLPKEELWNDQFRPNNEDLVRLIEELRTELTKLLTSSFSNA